MTRHLLALAAAAGLVLGACGGDGSDDVAATTTTSAAAAAATVTSAAAATVTTAPAGTNPAAAASAGAAVQLDEWAVNAPATYTAGPVTFDVTNGGETSHELLVVKGTYESLPRSNTGAVLEDQLPAGTIIGEVARMEPGATATVDVQLSAGPYVLLCNISIGPNSHAGKGQFLDVTVA